MTTTDQFWSAYANLQALLSNNTRITPKTMALEAALTALLSKMDSLVRSNNTDEINLYIKKSLNTCSWRERSRARLRTANHHQITRHVAAEAAPWAMVGINEARSRLTPPEWALLLCIAAGFSYQQLSTTTRSAQALRVMVSRARTRLKKAA